MSALFPSDTWILPHSVVSTMNSCHNGFSLLLFNLSVACQIHNFQTELDLTGCGILFISLAPALGKAGCGSLCSLSLPWRKVRHGICGYLGASRVHTETTLALLKQKGFTETKVTGVLGGLQVAGVPRDRKLDVGWVGNCKPISLLGCWRLLLSLLFLWLNLWEPLGSRV